MDHMSVEDLVEIRSDLRGMKVDKTGYSGHSVTASYIKEVSAFPLAAPANMLTLNPVLKHKACIIFGLSLDTKNHVVRRLQLMLGLEWALSHLFKCLKSMLTALQCRFLRTLSRCLRPLGRFLRTLGRFLRTLSMFLRTLGRFLRTLSRCLRTLCRYHWFLSSFEWKGAGIS